MLLLTNTKISWNLFFVIDSLLKVCELQCVLEENIQAYDKEVTVLDMNVMTQHQQACHLCPKGVFCHLFVCPVSLRSGHSLRYAASPAFCGEGATALWEELTFYILLLHHLIFFLKLN